MPKQMANHGIYRLPRKAKGHAPTLIGAVEEWLLSRQEVRNLSPVTIAWYRQRIAYLYGVVDPQGPVTAVGKDEIEEVLRRTRQREGVRKGRTVAAQHSVMRAFLNWCVRQGWEMDLRAVLLEPPKVDDPDRVEIYHADERKRLEAALEEHSLRDQLIYGLLLGTGVRLSELVSLKLTSKKGDSLEVFGKDRETRYPPVSRRLELAWTRYVQRERPRDGSGERLLLGRTGRPLAAKGVYLMLYRLGQRLDIHVHPHKFRHTFATLYIQNHLRQGKPFDPERLRLILGHESYALFPRYIHLAKADLTEGFNEIAPY